MANNVAQDHVRQRGIAFVLKPMLSKIAASKAIHKALQNIIIIAAAIETFLGFAGGDVRLNSAGSRYILLFNKHLCNNYCHHHAAVFEDCCHVYLHILFVCVLCIIQS